MNYVKSSRNYYSNFEITSYKLSFLWCFDQIPESIHSLQAFKIKFSGHATFRTAHLDERLARRRDLYLTAHNTHKRPTSMSPAETRTRNPGKREAADPRLRMRGHRDRQHSY